MPSNATVRDRVVEIAPQDKTSRKALVVGRDALTGGLLADALTRHFGLDAVVASPSELMRLMGRGEIALVTISADINSAAGTGFDLADSIYRSHPKTPIILLVDKLSYDTVLQAFRCGARGVFEQRESMSEFTDCVEHVRQGRIWVGREGTDHLLEALRKIPPPSGSHGNHLSSLTARELQVVQHAARGRTNKAIANELFLSEHTVKNYIFRAFEKLHVSNRVELLFYLATRGHSFAPPESELEEAAEEK